MKFNPYIFWGVFGFVLVVLYFGLTLLDYMESRTIQRARQSEHEYMIKQIESTKDLYPSIIFSGKYSAIRHEKPYEDCIEICKIRGQGK